MNQRRAQQVAKLLLPWAGIAFAVWLTIMGLGMLNMGSLIEQVYSLILLAVLVLLPLALWLILPDEFDTLIRAQIALLLGAVCLLIVSVLSRTTPYFSLLYLASSGGLVLLAARRFLRRAHRLDIVELCLDAALAYTAVGAIWLVAALYDIRLMGFDRTIVLLTAAHFHYIPLVGLLTTGLVGRRLRQHRLFGVYQVAAWGMLLTPLIVAAGITASPLLEVIGAIGVVLSLTTIAALMLLTVVPRAGWAGLPLAISAGVVFLSMGYAAAYALGEYSALWQVTIPRMVQMHGWVNGLGFGLCGVLGWVLLKSKLD